MLDYLKYILLKYYYKIYPNFIFSDLLSLVLVKLFKNSLISIK